MKRLFLYVYLAFTAHGFGQTVNLSVFSEISILTVGPGDELFTAFGHTAIRIKDPTLRLNAVFNYGMFDFDQPNFYLNFAKGKLLYNLGGTSYERFKERNQYEKRWMKEQVLNLTQEQKQTIFQFLIENIKPQNASYLYDPFYENCATKPVDILKETIKDLKLDTNYVDKNFSIRKLMNQEISQNTWGSFGINLALGSKIDKTATSEEYLFLPDYVFKSLSGASFSNGVSNFVRSEKDILTFEERKSKISVFSPSIIFITFLLLSLYLTYRDIKNKAISKWFDITLLGLTGLIGVGIIFLWFFTNHSTTQYNWNILWCFPLNLFILFFYKNKQILSYYFKIAVILMTIVPIIWLMNYQGFNYYIIPMLIILLTRYLLNIVLLTSKK